MGSPASVDWCEPNYLWSPWIAEFWNTLSSAPMVVVGLIALWRLHRAKWDVELRFVFCFIGLSLVGIGSMTFHGTLLHTAQALDELPMVYCSLVMTYCVLIRTHSTIQDKRTLKRWQFVLSTYGLAFTLGYFSSSDYFQLFIVSFAAVSTYLVLQGWRVVFRFSESAVLRRLYLVAALSFVSGVGVFWIPERALPCDHPLQALHLHAWWHVLAMTGTYLGFLVVLFDRLNVRAMQPHLQMGAVPWVSPGK